MRWCDRRHIGERTGSLRQIEKRTLWDARGVDSPDQPEEGDIAAVGVGDSLCHHTERPSAGRFRRCVGQFNGQGLSSRTDNAHDLTV